MAQHQHKFTVGQVVDFLPAAADGNVRRGRYTIQRLLPSEQGEPQYRVRHALDGYERVVTESRAQPAYHSSTAAAGLSDPAIAVAQEPGPPWAGHEGVYTMPFKPNYNFQRSERARLKQAKQDAKRQERAEAAATRREAEGETSAASSEPQPDDGAPQASPPAGGDGG